MTPKLLPALAGMFVLAAAPVHAQEAAPATSAEAAALGQPAAADTPPADVVAPAAVETPAVEAPPATGEQSASIVPPPPEGKGQVVFFRPAKFVGAAVSYKVREGETELGKLSNGRYFVHVTNPGGHAYVVHSEVQDVLTMEIDPGETYYVTSSLSVGVVVGRPNIAPSDKDAFDSVAAKLKLAK